MPSELEELVDFLATGKPEVKRGAAKIVEGLSGSTDGINSLKPQAQPLTRVLFRLVSEPDAEVSRAALVALVNLSQDPSVATTLLEANAVARVMDYIREKTSPHAQLLIMLLANITVEERGSRDMLQLDQDGLEGLHMAMLLKMFMVSAVTLAPGDEDAFEHVAAVLTNVTRLEAGRRLLLQPGRGLLQALAAQLQSGSSIRKQGCSSAIRNCCLAAEADGTLEHILADGSVLRRVLEPINGLDPKEADHTVREACAESIQVLASTEAGREALRAVDAPDILQKGYEYEEHPGVCSAMEHASRAFIFDNSGVIVEEVE